MSTWKSERTFWITVPDLSPVAQAVMRHFEDGGFQAAGTRTGIGGWDISISKGGTFKAVVGLKSALKIEITPQEGTTLVRAGVGIFGQQSVPTALTLLVAWPVVVTQAWGLIKQARLDDEAVEVVEQNLTRVAAGRGVGAPASAMPSSWPATSAPAGGPSVFCTSCGTKLTAESKFCSGCGQVRM
jgi:hypothetical protein